MIRRSVGVPGRGTVIGIGDDAAVYEPPAGLELLTCYAFVEEVHFRRDFASFHDIGAKCMVANVSDIASMGGVPTRAVVSLCVPSDVADAEVGELYGGLLEIARRYAIEIVGGDVVGSPHGLMVSVALTGAVDPGRVMTRAGAVEGDAVLVTGALGGAEAGLRALIAGLPDEGGVLALKERHRRPVPRLAEAQALIDVATPRAMIDVSDGLASEAWHLAEESDVGILIREKEIPIATGVKEVSHEFGLAPIDLALGSGEEFELVVTIPPSEVERTVKHVSVVTGTALTRIGDVIERSRGCVLERESGATAPLPRTGYEHLTGTTG